MPKLLLLDAQNCHPEKVLTVVVYVTVKPGTEDAFIAASLANAKASVQVTLPTPARSQNTISTSSIPQFCHFSSGFPGSDPFLRPALTDTGCSTYLWC
jgi:hypothetical protein